MNALVIFTCLSAFVTGTFAISFHNISMREGDSNIINIGHINVDDTFRINCMSNKNHNMPIINYSDPHLLLVKTPTDDELLLEIRNITLELNGTYDIVKSWMFKGELRGRQIGIINIFVSLSTCTRYIDYSRYELVLTCDIPDDSTDITWFKDELSTNDSQSRIETNAVRHEYNKLLMSEKRCSLNVELDLTDGIRKYELRWMRGNELRLYAFDSVVTRITSVDKYEDDKFVLKCMNYRVMYRSFDVDLWSSILINNFTLRFDNLKLNDSGFYACPIEEFGNVMSLNVNIMPDMSYLYNTSNGSIYSNMSWLFFVLYIMFTLIVL